MSYEPLRSPLYGTDERGLQVVRVPLSGLEAHAILDVAEYEALMARGLSPNWSFDGRMVRAGFRHHHTQRVARFLMDPPDGH